MIVGGFDQKKLKFKATVGYAAGWRIVKQNNIVDAWLTPITQPSRR